MTDGLLINPYRYAGAAWTPASLTNLEAWYDATDAGSFTYSSGVVVSQWNDLSGNGNHLTMATVGNQPLRNGTLNGLSAVVFDGIDDVMLTSGNVAFGTNHTMAVVATPSTGTDDYLLSLTSIDVIQSAIITKYSSKAFEGYNFRNSGSVTARFDMGANGATGHHCLILIRGGTGTSLTSLVNGSSSGSATWTGVTDSMTSQIVVGAALLNGTGAAASTIGEVVLTSDALSGADLTSLSDYLRNKWGTP